MADAAELLRLLEPLVRPVDGGGSSRAPKLPVEQQSFDSLLAEASTPGQDAADGEAADAEPDRPDPLGPLARVDAIENESLRAIVARSAQDESN
ncbi:MAG: hypothetical protein ACLFV3_10050 [Phycisphaeraceae bacterium]